jgi:hypothetical protein
MARALVVISRASFWRPHDPPLPPDLRWAGDCGLGRFFMRVGGLRFLAEGFCVDRQVIRRLLDNIVSEHMVTLQKTHVGTIITICNYDKYQSSSDGENPPENPDRTHVEPTSNPNKKETKELKKFKFEGKTIRLTESDYDRWRKSFFAIADFDAELTRIDAQVDGRGWFSAAANKLNYKHQLALTSKKVTPAPPVLKAGSPEWEARDRKLMGDAA